MPVVGLTGGIASGKTSVVRCLKGRHGIRVFEADESVHALLEGEAVIPVLARFGVEVEDKAGGINRRILREKVLDDSAARKDLEAILHPIVRGQWKELIEKFRTQPGEDDGCKLLVLDIPLLFEVQAENEMDFIVVVGCQSKTQRQRLKEQRGLDEATAEKFLRMQWPIENKLTRGDFVIWNDGPLALLEDQIDLLMENIRP